MICPDGWSIQQYGRDEWTGIHFTGERANARTQTALVEKIEEYGPRFVLLRKLQGHLSLCLATLIGRAKVARIDGLTAQLERDHERVAKVVRKLREQLR